MNAQSSWCCVQQLAASTDVLTTHAPSTLSAMRQSAWLVRAAPVCALLLASQGEWVCSFLMGRRPPANVLQSAFSGGSFAASADVDSEAQDWRMQTPLLPEDAGEDVSFVQSSSDDDDDDDDSEKGKSSEATSGEEHTVKESSEEKQEESKKEEESEKSEKAEEGHEKEEKEGGKEKDKKAKKEKKEKKKAKQEKKLRKLENLLTSREEQSLYIRKNMLKAADSTFKSEKRLIKAIDYLNGVVALLNQLVQTGPQNPQFSETVMFEEGGHSVSLKGILDEAKEVRKKVDHLFSLLSTAKHGIIGSINRAVPVRPATPPPGAK
ncbi:hypothetical protein ACSSS7_000500 [Eimeria intestinalis]